MPQVEFEPTIPVFQRAKTVHALVRAATVIGLSTYRCSEWYLPFPTVSLSIISPFLPLYVRVLQQPENI
jgi:hypothetical protein